MAEIKVILSDDILPTQWSEGEERGAFWGIAHSGPHQPEDFHDHVAVVTVEGGRATGITYFHTQREAEHYRDSEVGV